MTAAAPQTARLWAATAGSVAGVCALVILWVARFRVERAVYVSELGADGEATAGWFRGALLLIVAASFAIAWAGRASEARATSRAAIGVTLALTTAGALFFIASQVPCSSGCPLPTGIDMMQDWVHTASAVLAFAAAVVAMLCSASDPNAGAMRRISLGSAIAVALVAATGGIFSLIRFSTDVGGVLEFVATTIGVAWLSVYGLSVVAKHAPQRGLRRVEA